MHYRSWIGEKLLVYSTLAGIWMGNLNPNIGEKQAQK